MKNYLEIFAYLAIGAALTSSSPLNGVAAVWEGQGAFGPSSQDYMNIPTNWSTNELPQSNQDAQFNQAAASVPGISLRPTLPENALPMTIGGIYFENGVPGSQYNIDIRSEMTILANTGSNGVLNDSPLTQNFSINRGGILNFPAGNLGSPGLQDVFYLVAGGGRVNLSGTADASSASFNLNSSSTAHYFPQHGGILSLEGTTATLGTASLSIGNGTLITETFNIPFNKTLNTNTDGTGTIVFRQISGDGTFVGNIIGIGTIKIQGGDNIVTFEDPTSLSSFSGKTIVEVGKLRVSTPVLRGDLEINTQGLVLGTGTLWGNATVNAGGTIAPGDSIGTFNIRGNYTQNPGSIYEDEIDGAGQSDLINITGTAQLNGGDVQVISTDGILDPAARYTILTAQQGVSGGFSRVQLFGIDPSIYAVPLLSYDAQNAYVSFKTTRIEDIALSKQERNVARQLDSILAPSSDASAILIALLDSSAEAQRDALNQFAGDQYTNLIAETQIVNRQFLRTLYDPVRPIVSLMANPYQPGCSCPLADFWFEVGGTGSHYNNGYTATGCQLAGGAQKTICGDVTLGVAAGYAHDKVKYHDHGSGDNNTILGGVYALYRPCGYYILADTAFGYSKDNVKRHIDFEDLSRSASSHPRIAETTFYAEAGKDYHWQKFLLQPFVAVELDYLNQYHFKESGADTLNLHFHEKDRYITYGCLGVHTTLLNYCHFSFSLDLAWQYRFTSNSNTLSTRFEDFGSNFDIYGVKEGKNSFDGALNISTLLGQWTLYAELSGQVWQNAASYSILGGVQTCW